MKRTAKGLMFLGAVLVGALGIAASPIPIDGPIVITQSGNYIVTQDIVAVGEPAIRLSGEIVVSIDLGGHTISGAVAVRSSPGEDDDQDRTLSLRNGRLAGPAGGILASSSLWSGYNTVHVHYVAFENADIFVEDGRLTLASCVLVNSDVVSFGNRGGARASYVGNRAFNSEFRCAGCFDSQILNNVIKGGSIRVDRGDISGGRRVVVAGNTIVNGNIIAGDLYSSSEIQVVKNYVGGYIQLAGASDSWIYANQIFGCGGIGSAIVVDGIGVSDHNRIEANQFLGGCEHGIEFGYLTWDNVYSGNTFRIFVPEPIVDLGERNGPAGPEPAPE